MPHQNVHSSKATAQNAATDPVGPGDQTQAGGEGLRPEPRSYAASDVTESTLAPPAAGEVADFMDEGDPLGAHSISVALDGTEVAHWDFTVVAEADYPFILGDEPEPLPPPPLPPSPPTQPSPTARDVNQSW